MKGDNCTSVECQATSKLQPKKKEAKGKRKKKDVVGRARGFLPYVGMVTIIMNDYPKFKVGIYLYVCIKKKKLALLHVQL